MTLEEQLLQDIKSRATGFGEIGAMLGSGILAEPISGLAGLLGGDVRQTQDALTYQPRGEVAQGWLSSAAPHIEGMTNWINDKAIQAEQFSGVPREAIKAVPQMAAEVTPAALMTKPLNKGYAAALRNLETPNQLNPQAGMAVFPGNEDLAKPLTRNGEPLGLLNKDSLPMDEASGIMGDMSADMYKKMIDIYPYGLGTIRNPKTIRKHIRASGLISESEVGNTADYILGVLKKREERKLAQQNSVDPLIAKKRIHTITFPGFFY